MPLNTKTIKRRIKSVGSTRKITKAMEMISAVKMRKAVARSGASRAYAALAWETLSDIAGRTNIRQHPLLARREVKKIGLLFITSNRGLAGGFTTRLLQEGHQYIQKEEPQALVETILMGRRGQRLYTRFSHSIVAEFEKADLTGSAAEVMPMTRMIIDDYIAGKYDRVAIAYTDFVSPVKQVPIIKQLLPILPVIAGASSSVIATPQQRGKQSYNRDEEGLPDSALQRVDKPAPSIPEGIASSAAPPRNDNSGYGFKYEPNAKQVLNNLLPRLVETQIYQSILESDASEHSARMMAMKNASEAAEDMISELNYSYNKARQGAITQEISEIVGGVAGLG